jgi:hypothetical protein
MFAFRASSVSREPPGGYLGEDGGVFGLLWVAGPDHAVDDLEAQQAVGLAQHRDGVQVMRH